MNKNMLTYIVIFATVLACALATDEGTVVERDHEQTQPTYNGQQFKQAVETHDRVSKNPSQNCVSIDESKMKYTLYTRENPEGEMIVSKRMNLSDSFMNIQKPLKVIVHSWLQNKNWAEPIVRDYLFSQNVDVLMVDWSAYSEKCNIESITMHVTPVLAERLSSLLQHIISIGHKGSKMHLIGFGHGAHIVGIAGRLMTPHLPARITALDPLRLKEIEKPGAGKLAVGDARFIDVIVTSLPTLSFEHEVGDVTFYPNGGLTKHQENCEEKTNEMDKMICGHFLAYKLFAESLASPKKFPAVRCESYSKFQSGKCNDEALSHMGEFVEKSAKGRYFLEINKTHPHDKGVAFPNPTTA